MERAIPPSGSVPAGPQPSPHARYIVARLNYDTALLALLSAGATVEEVQREHEKTCDLMRKIAHVMGRGDAP